jgi:hypothetical protein
MKVEKAEMIAERIRKNAKIILKHLAEIRKNKSNKFILPEVNDNEIRMLTSLSHDEITEALEYMKTAGWVKLIPNPDPVYNPKYKLIVSPTNEGMEVYKKECNEKEE